MRSLLAAAVGADQVLAAGSIPADYGHDEALGLAPGEVKREMQKDLRGELTAS